MNRREFIAGSTALLLAGCAGSSSGAQSLVLQVSPQTVLATVPAGFLGLGYETCSVAVPGLFTPQNTTLIQLFRTLASDGLVRIGAIASDFATYSPNATPSDAPLGTVLNQAVIQNLGDFLRATGWKMLWGLNLARGTIAMAQQEAAAVAAAAGNSLLAFQFGNEPDAYAAEGIRPSGYDFPQYFAEFQQFLTAVRAVAPGAPVAGPDVASTTPWLTPFGQQEGDAKLLTHHFYAGAAASPDATISNLLQSNARLEALAKILGQISASVGIPYRLDEMNSLVGGGKAGVSDTFASALWGLDVLFTLVLGGGAGLNFENGLNPFGAISSYSPIVQDSQGNWVARPLYYGMLAFALAGKGKLVDARLSASSINLKAYAALHDDGSLWIALINKDLSQAASVRLELPSPFGIGEILELTAPSVDSTSNVTLGGAQVTSDGKWSPASSKLIGRTSTIAMPAASATLIKFAG